MADQPSFALQVSDISASLHFLVEILGFTLIRQEPAQQLAYVLDSDGDALLVFGPEISDATPYLVQPHLICKSGEKLNFGSNDLEALHHELQEKGLTKLRITQNRSGDRVLTIAGPDKIAFEFIQQTTHNFTEIIAFYARSQDELNTALAGLSNEDMGRSLLPESWNIRQIVHHLTETDAQVANTIRILLSSPDLPIGRTPTVGNDCISTQPEYRDRPIDTSLALFNAFHNDTLDRVKYVPNAHEHSATRSDGKKSTLPELLHGVNNHTNEHIDEILAIRKQYDL